MTSSRDRRVAKELQDIVSDRDKSGVYASPVDGVNMKHLKGLISGPPDTPYHGGTFTIDIQIPDNYPFKSPSMKFDTKIWHPNVSSQTVCYN
jgi:ubiquitin-conjugating enzyme (huntingtin interacting protein 2)